MNKFFATIAKVIKWIGNVVTGKSEKAQQEQKVVLQGLLVKARAKIQRKKQERLDKIIELFAEKEKITNDDVEKLIDVSHTTAFRYLNILEKQNKIKQVGKTGQSVFYIRI